LKSNDQAISGIQIIREQKPKEVRKPKKAALQCEVARPLPVRPPYGKRFPLHLIETIGLKHNPLILRPKTNVKPKTIYPACNQ
jgi:hypothetical protein